MSRIVRTRYSVQHTPTLARFHQDDNRNRMVLGPVGSGKSVAMVMEMYLRAHAQKPNEQGVRRTRAVIARNSYPELKSTTIKTFQEWVPEEIAPMNWGYPVTARMICPHADGQSMVDCEFIFLSLEHHNDRKKLLSLEPTFIWFNEAREFTFSLISAAVERPGRFPKSSKDTGDVGPTWHGMILDSNFPPTTHWIHHLAETQTPTSWSIYKQPGGLVYGNDEELVPNPKAENIPNLPGGYRYYTDMLETKADQDPSSIQVQICAQYGLIQTGRPVFQRSFNQRIHVAHRPLEPVEEITLVIALDFGNTPAAVFAQNFQGQVRVLHEETVDMPCGINEFWTQYVQPAIAERFSECRIKVIGDPTGKDLRDVGTSPFAELRRLGVNCQAAITNKIKDRLEAVRHYLTSLPNGQPGLLIDPTCHMLIEGFATNYRYRKLQVMGPDIYTDSPDKNQWSHPHDALQYACLDLRRRGQREKAAWQRRQHPTRQFAPVSKAGY